MTTLDDLAERHWREALATSPISATMFGVHDHDDRLGDHSSDGEAERRDAVASLLDETSKIEADHDRDRVVLAMLRRTLVDELDELGGRAGSMVSATVLRCEQMTGPHQALLRALPQVTYPEPAHAAMAVDRYRDTGRYLTEAADRFLEALDHDLPPVHRNVERLLGQVDGYLASDLDDDALIAVGGPQDWDGEAAWRDQLRDAVRDELRPALARFAERLRDEQLPHGRDDEHAGLAYVDASGELYARASRLNTSLDLAPDEIHRIGLEHVEGQLAREWSRLGQVTFFAESDPRTLMDRMRDEPSLRYDSSEAVVRHAEEAVARATAVMQDWFGRLPEAACVVEPVPAYLAASAPPAYYIQPSPDGSRPGTYFINAADLGAVLRTEAEATAFHEAIPGHHLQLAISGELDDVPEFLMHGVQVAYAEGWGLYAERLADEMGLYSSDVDRLGMLTLDAFRAGRLVVDTGLHAHGWSRQRAIDWMITHTPLPLQTIEAEVDRYIAMPGQALGYKLGQREIMRLRADAEQRLGAAFDVKGFHDAVLGHGMLTLDVLGSVVDRWVANQV